MSGFQRGIDVAYPLTLSYFCELIVRLARGSLYQRVVKTQSGCEQVKWYVTQDGVEMSG